MPLNMDSSPPARLRDPVLQADTNLEPLGTHASSMSVAVATLDARGKVLVTGGALAELVDQSVSELLGLEFANLFTVDDASGVLLAIDRCLSGIASWLSVRLVGGRDQAEVWLRLEPMVTAAVGSTARIGVAVVRAPESWRPHVPVEVPLPLRTAIDDLRTGLASRQFELQYQPIIHLGRPHVVGVEALLRWRHPQAGLLLPADFLPVTEAGGVTGEITAYVLHEACAQAARWPDWRVAVNLFPADLRSTSIVERVAEALSASSLPPERLSLELTEASLVDQAESTLGVLTDLRGLGVRLSLDDFGTGYSSLLYLRDFPITELKIDREFVNGLSRPGHDPAIVSSVLSLAVTLDLDVVAVGVQTPHQLGQLQLLGCEIGQGFLLSAPLSADQVDALHADPSAVLARTEFQPGPATAPVSLSEVDGIGDDPVTATIASLQQQGASLHSIAAALNQSQQRTRDGKRWTAAAVASLIHTLTRPGTRRASTRDRRRS